MADSAPAVAAAAAFIVSTGIVWYYIKPLDDDPFWSEFAPDEGRPCAIGLPHGTLISLHSDDIFGPPVFGHGHGTTIKSWNFSWSPVFLRTTFLDDAAAADDDDDDDDADLLLGVYPSRWPSPAHPRRLLTEAFWTKAIALSRSHGRFNNNDSSSCASCGSSCVCVVPRVV